MVKRANAKAPPEESIALRVAVLVAVLAAPAWRPRRRASAGWALRIVATVGIAAGFAYSHWARYRDGYLLKAMLAVGVLLAFGAFLKAATGIAGRRHQRGPDPAGRAVPVGPVLPRPRRPGET